MRRPSPPAFAVGIVVATVAILWALGDVGAGQAFRAVAYEAGFVVLPGFVAFVAVDGRSRTLLAKVAFGWALGYALEVGAFCATAAIDKRWMFWLYPVAVVVGGVAWSSLRARSPKESVEGVAALSGDAGTRTGITTGLALGVGCSLMLVYAALGAFPLLPLPGGVSSVAYHADSVVQVALTAEAAHHWPLTVPWISGQHLSYHWLAFAHTGAFAQVTGLEPALIAFRLATPLMLVAAFLLAIVAGTRISGSERVGALGAILLFLVGELHLTTAPIATFLGTFREALWKSSTFLFGLVFFLAVLPLVWEQLDPEGPRRRTWLVLAVLLFASGGAKGAAPVVLLGGVALYGVWRLVTQRRIEAEVVRVGALIAVIFALDWLVFIHGQSESLSTAPLASLRQSNFYLKLVPYIPEVWRPLLGLAGAAGLLVPLAGIFGIFAGRRRVTPAQGYLLCVFLAGFLGFVLVDAPGGILPELWFLTYGHAAGVLLSAWGAMAVWRMASERPSVRTQCLIAVGLVIFATGWWVVRIDKPFSWEARSQRVYIAFLAVAIALVLIAWTWGRTVGMARGAAAITALALVLGGGALDGPMSLSAAARSVLKRTPAYERDTPTNRGMTTPLYNGLRWVRAHTSYDAVIAVNNHYVNAETNQARYLYYSAFAERRVFLESWWYSARALALGTPAILKGAQPFPKRFDLNERVFEQADADAARELHQRFGVDYLLVDHTHGTASPDIAKLGRLVHSDSAISVYLLS